MIRGPRRRRDNRAVRWTATVIWGLALLSLMLLPTNFRAGAETLHGHSLAQLWIDAADGRIDHHHPAGAHDALVVLGSWLDPRVDLAAPNAEAAPGQGQPDVGEHEQSTAAPGGIHLLLSFVTFVPPAIAAAVPTYAVTRPPVGRTPRVLLPPPRLEPIGA